MGSNDWAVMMGATAGALLMSGGPPAPAAVLLRASPEVVVLAKLAPAIDVASVTDIRCADFDGDGWLDLAVAWYATDHQSMSKNRRVLSLIMNRRGTLAIEKELDLYVPDYANPALSVFRNGTAALAVGDFDGDGDVDLAVTAFFGDELWLIENLGGGAYAQHLRFPFGFNSPAVFLTPPQAHVADFDGDGRVDLVYVADPIQHVDGEPLHFWKSWGTISGMCRVDWTSNGSGDLTQWTRALAVDDFTGDGRADLCFTGTNQPPNELGPVLRTWSRLDGSGLFRETSELPWFVCADALALRPTAGALPGFVLTDKSGFSLEYWRRTAGVADFERIVGVNGYAALSPNRGMAIAAGDLDGDGDLDLVTKQKGGGLEHPNQIEITLCADGGAAWTRVQPSPVSTVNFRMDTSNDILRPRNLVVADLFGSPLPEVIAGFASTPNTHGSGSRLELPIWMSGTRGDLNRDGMTNSADIGVFCRFEGVPPAAWPAGLDPDLNRDGIVNGDDLAGVLADYGTGCAACAGVRPADADCSGAVTWRDLDAFILALQSAVLYAQAYPGCPPANSDCNGDGVVSWRDIDPFMRLLQFSNSGHPPVMLRADVEAAGDELDVDR